MNCLHFSSGRLSLWDVHLNVLGRAAARGRGQSWGDREQGLGCLEGAGRPHVVWLLTLGLCAMALTMGGDNTGQRSERSGLFGFITKVGRMNLMRLCKCSPRLLKRMVAH